MQFVKWHQKHRYYNNNRRGVQQSQNNQEPLLGGTVFKVPKWEKAADKSSYNQAELDQADTPDFEVKVFV